MIEVTDKSKCCGCTACASICPKQCITMQEDEEGFLYPVINKSLCIGCNLCQKVCPILNQEDERKSLSVYAAKSRDEKMRLASSSGGVFTLLAEKIIDRGGVVFGARFNENWEVIHDCTETKEGLAAFRGSKYVQSCIGNCYSKAKQYIQDGRQVMFSGTPCQIAGLKRFLGKDYDNLLAVDIVCHGVPSPKAWRLYLRDIVSDKQWINSIRFRAKSNSWRNFRLIIEGADSRLNTNELVNEKGYENKWIHAFLLNLTLRLSCHDCQSLRGKSGSDLTLGDYWGIEQFAADFDDDKGCSLVLVNTLKGEEIYSGLNCNSIVTPYKSAVLKNPSLERSVTASINRKFLLSQLDKGFIAAYDACLDHSFPMRLRRFLFRKLGM